MGFKGMFMSLTMIANSNSPPRPCRDLVLSTTKYVGKVYAQCPL